MTSTKKIETGAPKIEALRKEIESGRNIDGTIILDLPCLGCDKILPHAMVRATNGHKPNSFWNYFVHCPECNYQSNLAKFVPEGGGRV